MQRTIPIAFEGQGGHRSQGLAIVQHLEGAERSRRALRTAAPFVGGGLLTLLIPIVHFVAPPVLLALAVVLFVRRMGQGDVIQGGGGPCPRCEQRVDLEPQPLHWPVDLNCPHCRRSLVVQPSAELADA